LQPSWRAEVNFTVLPMSSKRFILSAKILGKMVLIKFRLVAVKVVSSHENQTPYLVVIFCRISLKNVQFNIRQMEERKKERYAKKK
jgi:hypothetical protein